MTQHEALEVIGEIYDAALQPERWPETLRKVHEFVGASEPLLPAPPADPTEAIALAELPEAQQGRVRMLLPHLLRAAEIMQRLREAQAKRVGALAALEDIGCGVVILDERAVATFCNRSARRTFSQNDGLKLRSRGPGASDARLLAAEAPAQKALERAIEECLRPDVEPHDCSRGVRISRPSKRPDYIVQINALATRVDLRALGAPGAAIVFISDPDSELVVEEALLRRLYALTPAESRLAQLLVNGETLAGAAKRLGISETTAKTQLQNLFWKTGTHRQPELVKLLLSLASTTLR